MALTLAEKIIREHIVSGKREKIEAGEEIAIAIDQTLTQDATGTLVYLEFEALGIEKVKTELSVSYVDHNMLQVGYENADDHRYLQSAADRFGIYFSKPGNGICHQVHLERFSKPGKTLLGSDSHTPTSGGAGMLAIGAGGLDVALAMAGEPFYFKIPQIAGVKLTGKLNPWVSTKDVILELLRRLTVKGGAGKIFEYFGEGVKTLTVPERATITNMGAELGATTSVFPADESAFEFLKAQGREKDYKALKADSDAEYSEIIEINLSELEPMIALPSSPDNVKKVSEVEKENIETAQVIIGSCTNSSYKDLAVVARVLRSHRINPKVDVSINPGSRQVITSLAKENSLLSFINAGVRICEPACLGCIGTGQSPPSDAASLRTFNRNFKGRSGTEEDFVFLCSPETAIASAIYGRITDPRKLPDYPHIALPAHFEINDAMILTPTGKSKIARGPNIAELPKFSEMSDALEKEVLIKLADNVTTDDIMPAGSLIKYRSNIPKYADYVFSKTEKELAFSKRAKEKKGGIIIGGENYGQGSSREHAALCCRYLGIEAVIAKSFARIHRDNLINFGILPLEFKNKDDFSSIDKGDLTAMNRLKSALGSTTTEIKLQNKTRNKTILLNLKATEREREILLSGGLLNYVKKKQEKRA